MELPSPSSACTLGSHPLKATKGRMAKGHDILSLDLQICNLSSPDMGVWVKGPTIGRPESPWTRTGQRGWREGAVGGVLYRNTSLHLQISKYTHTRIHIQTNASFSCVFHMYIYLCNMHMCMYRYVDVQICIHR